MQKVLFSFDKVAAIDAASVSEAKKSGKDLFEIVLLSKIAKENAKATKRKLYKEGRKGFETKEEYYDYLFSRGEFGGRDRKKAAINRRKGEFEHENPEYAEYNFELGVGAVLTEREREKFEFLNLYYSGRGAETEEEFEFEQERDDPFEFFQEFDEILATAH